MTGDNAEPFGVPDPYSYGERAKAARSKAQQTTSLVVRTSLERIAASYERLAEQQAVLKAREQAMKDRRWPVQPPFQLPPQDGEA